jgi:SAM-dependent methyltransferase
MSDETAANLNLWESWADLHAKGSYYDVEGFIADPGARPFDRVIREVVGDVAGKRLLHLQCHIGLDTLRFALAGAVDVTGVDFSPRAVAAARSIAQRMGASATFVQADVCALPDTVPRDAFDVVFTSYGTIMWLADLEPWADSIATRLAPGGVFHIVDAHPFALVFDDEAEEGPLRIGYPYFAREPFYYEEHGSYADRDADLVADSYWWQHTMSEIVGVLARRGLVVESLREYPVVAWKAFEFLVEVEEGLWRLPPEAGDIPLMFALSVRRPG